MTKNFQYVLRPLDEKDEPAIVDLLRASSEGTIFEQWTWKYKLNPNFDPSLVMVAEKEGKIVGFLTTTTQKLKISRSIMMNAIGCPAEILVHPNHRNQHVGKHLTFHLLQKGKERDFLISYGVSSPEVYQRFWLRVANAASIQPSTVVYTKQLNCDFVRPWVSKINKVIAKNNQLTKVDLSILFRLKQVPHFTIRIYKCKVHLIDRETPVSNIIIEGSMDTVRSIVKGRRLQIWVMLKALLTRNLRTKGVLQNIFELYSCFRALVSHIRTG